MFAAAVAQSVRAFAPQAEGWGSNPSRDRANLKNQVVTALNVSVTGLRR